MLAKIEKQDYGGHVVLTPRGQMKTEVHLTMQNNFVSLANLIRNANLFLDSFTLPERVMYVINLVLEEILTNIVKYAFDDDKEHEIFVNLGINKTEVWMECLDEGREFNPLAAHPPEIKECFEECEVGGVGIHLVKKMVDSMEYRRYPSKNVLFVRVKVPSE